MLWGRRAGKRKLPGLVRMGMVVGDLEEVEEWNEYGELKDNVGAPARKPAATPTPSTSNTPSKPPAALSTSTNTPSKGAPTMPSRPTVPLSTNTPTSSPSKPPPSSNTDSPLTTAMRQAGFEAAKKAGDAKSKARADALEAAKANKEGGLEKLDQAGPTGMPPPSGTTEAVEALKGVSGNTNVGGKADEVPTTKEGEKGAITGKEEKDGKTATGEAVTMKDIPSSKEVDAAANTAIANDEESEVLEGKGQAEVDIPTSKEVEAAANESIMHDKSHIVLVGKREQDRTPPTEMMSSGQREDYLGHEPTGKEEALMKEKTSTAAIESVEDRMNNVAKKKDGTGTREGIAATDEAQGLPGKRTQDQEAASGESVGDSVAD